MVTMEVRKENKMGRDRYTKAFDHQNMTPAPASDANIRIIWTSEDGIQICTSTASPPSTANTFAEGCLYIKSNAASNDTLYVNNGTYASPSFEKIISTGNVIDEIENDHLADTAAGVGPSPLIWDGAPWLEVALDPAKGFSHWEDFGMPDVYATTVLNGGLLFTIVQGGSGTCAALTTSQGGILQMSTAADAADDGAIVQFPGLQCLPAVGTTIYYEARVNVNNDQGDIFIGLGDSAGVTDFLNNGTVITNKDYAAFFRDDGTADANISAAACDGTNITTEDDVVTDVDKDAYIKYGVVINGIGGTDGSTVKFYVDGVLVKTVTEAGANDGVPDKVICPVFEVAAHTTAAILMNIDWFRLLVYNSTNGTARA